MNTQAIDTAARKRADELLSAYPDRRLPEHIQRRIRPLLTTRLKKAA